MGRLLTFTLIAGTLLFGGYVLWLTDMFHFPSNKQPASKEALQQAKAETALAHGDFALVLELAKEHMQEIERKAPEGAFWERALIDASTHLKHTRQLAMLFEHYPESFRDKEEASLLVATSYLSLGQTENYAAVRKLWQAREGRFADWFLLDVDLAILLGKRDIALNKLRDTRLNREAEPRRLIRLAALVAQSDPKAAWRALAEAEEQAPSSDIYLHKAALLQTNGKDRLAIEEYRKALSIDPANPHLWESFGDQLVKIEDPSEASNAYVQAFRLSGADYVWIKAFFWNKVAGGKAFADLSFPKPQGKQEAVVHYLQHLPINSFWDSAAFQTAQLSDAAIEKQPALFWLKLLSLLQEGDKDALHAWLSSRKPSGLWDAPLLEQITALAEFQWKPDSQDNTLEPLSGTFDSLLAAPSAFWPTWARELAASPYAYPLLLLQKGWLRSGIALAPDGALPATRPDEAVFAFIHAYQAVDGHPSRALSFALKQTRTPGVAIEIARMQLALDQKKQAIRTLQAVSTDAPGFLRAKQALLQIALTDGDYSLAYEILSDVPALKQTVLGKETLAHQALQAGNVQEAAALYQSIMQESTEAKAFLARKAYSDKDFALARKLTEELLQEHQDNALLKENLQKISLEERRLQSKEQNS